MTRLAILAGIAIAGGLLLAFAFHHGAAGEKAKTAAREARELTEQIKDRSLIDDQVERMSAADLCAGLGGLWHDGKCE
jgi:hypothetical protein